MKQYFSLSFSKTEQVPISSEGRTLNRPSTPAGVLQLKAEEVIKMGLNTPFTLPIFYWL